MAENIPIASTLRDETTSARVSLAPGGLETSPPTPPCRCILVLRPKVGLLVELAAITEPCRDSFGAILCAQSFLLLRTLDTSSLHVEYAVNIPKTTNHIPFPVPPTGWRRGRSPHRAPDLSDTHTPRAPRAAYSRHQWEWFRECLPIPPSTESPLCRQAHWMRRQPRP